MGLSVLTIVSKTNTFSFGYLVVYLLTFYSGNLRSQKQNYVVPYLGYLLTDIAHSFPELQENWYISYPHYYTYGK